MNRIAAAAASLALGALVAGCEQKIQINPVDAGCTPSCQGKRCGDDGCGGSCGGCPAGQTCDPQAFTCGCAAETDGAFCDRLGRACGPLSDVDNCGHARTVECNRCQAPSVCDAAAGRCVCDAESDEAFCARNAGSCGRVVGLDNCGESRSAECACDPGEQCNTATGSCEPCTPEADTAFCTRLSKECGSVTGLDNCRRSRTADCGGCVEGKQCDATSDQCVCAPQTSAQFCADRARECGYGSGNDNCGYFRDQVYCGACAGYDTCDEASGRCAACVPESDAAFCARNGKVCDSFPGYDNCGSPRTVDCGLCPLGKSCTADNLCARPGGPTNDDCTTPQRLSFTSGLATVAGSTANAADDAYASCGSGGAVAGPDVVYSFTVRALTDVVATLTTQHTVGLLSLRSACGDVATELACARGASGAQVNVEGLTPGDYFLWVDSYDGLEDDFTLSVQTTTPPAAPANDSCARPEVLQFTNGKATVTGTTRSATNDTSGSCAASSAGPDVVYSFQLTSAAAVRVEVTRGSSRPQFQPVVYLASACSGGSSGGPVAGEQACNAGMVTAVASVPSLGRGTWFVVVDGATRDTGDFTLTVETGPEVTNDTCASPKQILIDATTKSGTVTSDTGFARDDAVTTCDAFANGPDLVFSFDVPQGRNQTAQIDVVSAPGVGAFIPYLSVRTACDLIASELGCATDATPTNSLTLERLAPGTYYIWIDGSTVLDAGSFSLSVALSTPPPPANDSCSAAEDLVLDLTTGEAHVTGTTVSATDDSTGTCDVMAGPDVVYRFTLAQPSRVSARVERAATSGAYTPAIYLRGVCERAVAGDEKGCATSGYSGIALFSLANLAAGEWYLIVDGTLGGEGDFSLDLQAIELVSNFTCATALPLHFDPITNTAAVRSDTTNGTDVEPNSCVPNSNGHEVVFSFEVPAGPRQDVALSAAPIPGSVASPVVSVRRSCAALSSEIGCVQRGANPSADLTLHGLAAGTYYVWVDQLSSHADGPFTLTATMSPSVGLPANDSCNAPQQLLLDPLTGIATATGDTAAAASDESGSCSTVDGPDVIYSFDLGSAKDVRVDVQPAAGSSLKPVVYLRSSCSGAATEVGCVAATPSSANGAVSLVKPRLARGTYYLVVDSASAADAGAFQLQVTASAPPPPATNDTCRNAQALVLNTATQTASVTATTLAAAGDDYAGSCATAAHPHSGQDLVYSVTVPSAARVVATVTRAATSPGYEPAVYIAQTCNPAAQLFGELACGQDAAGTGVARANAKNVIAGLVYVVVDGIDATVGEFTLEVKLGPPGTNDTCATPLALTVDPVTNTASITGDTSDGIDDTNAGCNNFGRTGNDLVYSLAVPAGTTKDLEITVAGTAPMLPVVSVRSTCGSMASELGCANDVANPTTGLQTATLQVHRLSGGATYYLWVDGENPYSNGEFTMIVSMTDSTAAVTNDTCATPQDLTFDLTGKATVTGSTLLSVNDYTGSCGTFNGADNVYRFHLDGDYSVTAVVTPDRVATPNYYPAAYLRTDCVSSAAADELVCARTKNYLATVVASVLHQGDYYLIVDGNVGSSGNYTLEVKKQAAFWGDSCLGPQELQFTNGVAVVNGDTTSALANGTGTCGGDYGEDLVYSFTTTVARTFSAEMVFANTFYHPVVFLRSRCGDSTSQLACATSSISNRASISISRLAPGTYYLWADSASTQTYSQKGPFTLTVTLTAPPGTPSNDTCGLPQQLQFNSVTNIATATGDTTNAFDDFDPSCAAGSGNDLVYSFTTAGAQKVVATVTKDPMSVSFVPVVTLRTDCGRADPMYELTCGYKDITQPAATATVNNLPQGTYWIVVDGAVGTVGSFTLQVELSAAVTTTPANESCGSVEALTVTGGTAQVVGTTLGAQDEARGGCAAQFAPDVVYSVTTSAAQKIVATVTPDASSTYQPVVYIRKTCDGKAPNSELACANASGSGAAATATVKNAPAGTYWIWIDGGSATAANASGAFTLDLALQAPVTVANDTCANAIALALATPVSGDTTDATNDYGAFTSTQCSSTSAAASPDVVYSYTPSTTGAFTVTVAPTTSWDVVVWVGTGTCGAAGSCAAFRDAGATGATETLVVSGQANSTYYIVIEGYNATSAGPFTIRVD